MNSSVQKWYDDWHREKGYDVWRLQRAYCDLMSRLLPYIGEPKFWLDVGCGVGNFLVSVRRRFPVCRRYGIDLSTEAIELSHKMVPSAVIRQADMMERFPGRENEMYDVVSLLGVVEHAPRPSFVFTRCWNVMSPHAKLIALVPVSGFIGYWFGWKGTSQVGSVPEHVLSLKEWREEFVGFREIAVLRDYEAAYRVHKALRPLVRLAMWLIPLHWQYTVVFVLEKP